jgi:hypothetical protein
MSTKHDKRVEEYKKTQAWLAQSKKDRTEAMKIRPKEDLGIPPGGFERGTIKKKKKKK